MCTVAMPPASVPSAGLIRKSMDCGGGAIVECSQRLRDQPVPLTGLLEPPRDSDESFDTQKASRYHQRYPTHAVMYLTSDESTGSATHEDHDCSAAPDRKEDED